MLHRIAVLAVDRVNGFDLGVPAQVFGAARACDGSRLYEVTTCTLGARPVRSTGGFRVLPAAGLAALADADTIVVPGIEGGPPLSEGSVHPEVAAALVLAFRRGARVMSICTGAAVLAAAGLLDGRPATTHWAHAERLRTLYPRVRFDPDQLFIDDGAVLTSGGAAAGIDLCLHVIRRDHGVTVANRAARRCVVVPWRDGGQAPFMEGPSSPAGSGLVAGTTAAARQWALSRLDESLTLRQLADQARMSVRTFTRRFRQETGTSANRWLLTQRVEHARLLLETTDLSVDMVARRAGLGGAAALRQHLRASIGVAPTAYRRAFRPPVPQQAGRDTTRREDDTARREHGPVRQPERQSGRPV